MAAGRLGKRTATSPSTASAAAKTRTQRASRGALTRSPAARRARTRESGSAVLATPAATSRSPAARYGAVTASTFARLAQHPGRSGTNAPVVRHGLTRGQADHVLAGHEGVG